MQTSRNGEAPFVRSIEKILMLEEKIDQEIDLDLDLLAYIDPGVTVNVIRDGELVEKRKPEMPKRIVNVMKCKNPRCITTAEPSLKQIFCLTDEGDRKTYRCFYCEAERR